MKNNASSRFDEAMRKVLSVSHEELKRREEQWKAEKAAKKRKSKASASGRVSGDKG